MFGFQLRLATIGIAIMAFGNTGENSLVGFIFGITSSIGFSSFFCNIKMEKRNT